jgi:hypothetical protein
VPTPEYSRESPRVIIDAQFRLKLPSWIVTVPRFLEVCSVYHRFLYRVPAEEALKSWLLSD